MDLNNVYRWCNAVEGGGGIVFAYDKIDALEKLKYKYGTDGEEFIIWHWTNDDYFDEFHPDVFDIYD